MKCADAERILFEPGAGGADSAEFLRHLQECERCRAIGVGLGMIEGVEMSGSGKVASEAIERLEREGVAAVGSAPGAAATLARVLVVVAALAAVGAIALGTRGLNAMSAAQLAGFAVVVVACVLAGWVGLDRALRPGSAGPMVGRWGVAALGMSFAALLWLLGRAVPSEGLVAGAALCFGVGSVVAVAGMFGVSLLMKWGYVVNRGVAGAALGAVGGAAALAVLHTYCPKVEVDHLILGHGAAMVAAAAAGWLLTKQGVQRGA